MKKFLALALCLSVMAIATACGSGDESAEVPEDTQTQEEMTETMDETMDETDPAVDAEAEAEGETDADAEAVESTFTGILDEKKDFMIVVSTEDKSESYVFNLAEGVQCDAEVGAEVTVTFTGDMEVPVADQDLTATEIVTAE